MKKPSLEVMPTDQLVDRFSQLAFAQDDTYWTSDARRYNALYRQITPVVEELRRRGELERLECLLSNVNVTVRLEAARRLLRIVPEKVSPVLQAMKDSKHYPWAAEASGMLRSEVFGNVAADARENPRRT